jgi:hypothetical protein
VKQKKTGCVLPKKPIGASKRNVRVRQMKSVAVLKRIVRLKLRLPRLRLLRLRKPMKLRLRKPATLCHPRRPADSLRLNRPSVLLRQRRVRKFAGSAKRFAAKIRKRYRTSLAVTVRAIAAANRAS